MTAKDLHTVFVKHDGTFQSLTKKAMADVLIKIVYLHSNNGTKLTSKKVKEHLEKYLDVKFSIRDIESALGDLVGKKKLKTKSGEYYIDPSHRSDIQAQVDSHNRNKEKVLNYWFGKSESKSEYVKDWFENLIIKFFQDYRYDWINDLMSRRVSGNKKTPKIADLLIDNFTNDILESDREWLSRQFTRFIESDRNEDHELLWYYGSSMFASTLLTARNYADDLSFDLFKDSKFILDTNILMILELEGHTLSDAFEEIEKSFIELNIEPVYFHISQEEYLRALDHKRTSTLISLEKFDIEVLKESDCPFVVTAFKRRCKTPEDFQRYFKQLSSLPEYFFEKLKVVKEDYGELLNAIEEVSNDEKTKEQIDLIHRRRTGQPKRPSPKIHDAGLIGGAKYLRKNGRTWILTKDGTIREYANRNLVRNEYPLAIGIDSFIQMLAISNGGTANSASNFAPLFAQVIQSSLTPERDTFRMEDLCFIHESKIGIDKLSNDRIIEIARTVNKLRFSGLNDDEIALEIRRAYETTNLDLQKELHEFKTTEFQLRSESERLAESNTDLEKNLKDEKFKNWLVNQRIRAAFSWGKLLGLLCLLSFLIHFLMKYASAEDPWIAVGISFAIELVIIFSFKLNVKWTFGVTKSSKEAKKKELDIK